MEHSMSIKQNQDGSLTISMDVTLKPYMDMMHEILRRTYLESAFETYVKDPTNVTIVESHRHNGVYHNTSGPAITLDDSVHKGLGMRYLWALNGKLILDMEMFIRGSGMTKEEEMLFRLKYNKSDF